MRPERCSQAEACVMLQRMMTGVNLRADHPLASLTSAERRKVVVDHGGLECVLNCVEQAHGDEDDRYLLDAFESLAELGCAEGCRAQMVEGGALPHVLSLMSQHLDNPRVAELGCHLGMLMLWRRAEAQESVAALPYDGGPCSQIRSPASRAVRRAVLARQ